jgi:predicted acetyltransferase
MRFRRAETGDIERLIEIHTSVFPNPRGADARRTNFERNPLGGFSDLHVAVDSGIVVAHAFLFSLEMGFGGVRVRVGGIATVGVAPEARGTGVAGALLDHVHGESTKRGDALTALYAFRQGFYAKKGYAPVSAAKYLTLSPRAIPRSWRKHGFVRAARGEDRAAIVACHERAVLRGAGLLVRPERFWDRHFASERRRFYVATNATGDVRGYIAWSVTQTEAHAKTTLDVRELVADDDDARRALLGLVGAQRDQVSEVVMQIDDADPIYRSSEDADQMTFGTEDVEHTLGLVVAGPMVRIDDAARAITARGYAKAGAIDVAISGGASLRVEIDQGRARVTESGRGPTLALEGAQPLAQILYGGLAVRDAARLGLASAESPATLDLADALFATPPYFALDPF